MNNDITPALPDSVSEHEVTSAEVAQMEDTVRLAGVGIEDVDTGDELEANIVRAAGSFVIRLHRRAPCRVWVLHQALAFIQAGHPKGLRADSYQPAIRFEINAPPLSS